MAYIQLIKRSTTTKQVAVIVKGKKTTYKTVTTSTSSTLNLRTKSIEETPQLKSTIKPYVGSEGSSTQRTGTGGRLITINGIARNNDILRIKKFAADNGYFSLVSQSAAEYNGEYYIIDLNQTEKHPGIFDITLKLQERSVFNATYMNFKTFDVLSKQNGTSRPIQIGEKWTE